MHPLLFSLDSLTHLPAMTNSDRAAAVPTPANKHTTTGPPAIFFGYSAGPVRAF